MVARSVGLALLSMALLAMTATAQTKLELSAPQHPERSDFLQRVVQQPQTRSELQPQLLALATRDDRGQPWYLGQAGRDGLKMLANLDPNQGRWTVVPAARGLVRVQHQVASDWLALSVGSRRQLSLHRVAQDAGQLWRVVASGPQGGYWLESVTLPGMALAGTPAGSVALMPIDASAGQLWWPMPIEVGPAYEPLWRSISHEVRPSPALPPAQLDLVNSHKSPLVVLIGDRRAAAVRQLRIEPASHATVAFDRDAGATIVETYEVRGPNGLWDRQQFVTPIPPMPIYDLSVYEEFLQSIAIDRTGTSPHPIEDINYQPKSLGFVVLPAGTALPDRGQLDPYVEARAANNAGAVRRIDPRNLEKPALAEDPLESKLREVTPRKKF